MTEDAFGRMLRDYHDGELVDRPRYRWGDGSVEEADVSEYFSKPESWREWTREALASLDGNVLDLGCGAGRHSLWLQRNGATPVTIDRSPGAIAVASERGVAHCVRMDLRSLGLRGPVHGVVAIGNQLRVGGTISALRSRLDTLTSRNPVATSSGT